MKHMIRTGNNITPQIINRIKEIVSMVNELNSAAQQDSHQYPVIINKAGGVLLQVGSNFMLRKAERDGSFMSKNNLIMKFAGVVPTSDGISVKGQYFLKQHSFFMDLCDSALLHIFCAKINDLTQTCHEVSLDDIKCMLSTIDVNEWGSKVVIPLLHTLVK